MKTRIIQLIFAAGLVSASTWAQELNVVTVSDQVIEGLYPSTGCNPNQPSCNTIIEVFPKCYGTNLRGVGNPMSKESNLRFNIVLDKNGTRQMFSFSAPSRIAVSSRAGSSSAQDPANLRDVLSKLRSFCPTLGSNQKLAGFYCKMNVRTVRQFRTVKKVYYQTCFYGDGSAAPTGVEARNWLLGQGAPDFVAEAALGGSPASLTCSKIDSYQAELDRLMSIANGMAEKIKVHADVPNALSATLTEIAPGYLAFSLPKADSGQISTSPLGAITSSSRMAVSSVDVIQYGITNNGQYYGRNGAISNMSRSATVTDDQSRIKVSVLMPGEEGYCGGFHSPLMLFFGEPKLNMAHTTQREINGQEAHRFWPEYNKEAAFLVLPKGSDVELFGTDQDAFANGFEKLAQHDLNKDGKIDSQDPVFKELRLWFDRSNSGKVNSKDLKTLSSRGVQAISLKYKLQTESLGGKAEFRERSEFEFVKDGKAAKGSIIDVWLGMAN